MEPLPMSTAPAHAQGTAMLTSSTACSGVSAAPAAPSSPPPGSPSAQRTFNSRVFKVLSQANRCCRAVTGVGRRSAKNTPGGAEWSLAEHGAPTALGAGWPITGAAVEGGARQGCLRGGRAPAFPAGGGPGSWPGACGPAGVDIISKRGKGPGLSNSRAALQQTHTERGFRACGPLSGGGDLLLPKQQPRGGSSPDKSHWFRSAAPSPLSPRARDSRAETTAGRGPLQALPRLPPRRPGSPPVSRAQGPGAPPAPPPLRRHLSCYLPAWKHAKASSLHRAIPIASVVSPWSCLPGFCNSSSTNFCFLRTAVKLTHPFLSLGTGIW